MIRTALRICICISDSSDVSLSRLTCGTRYRWVFSWVTGRGRNHDDTMAGRGREIHDERKPARHWEMRVIFGTTGKTEFGLFASMICSQSLTNTGCFPKVSKICCLSKTLCSSVPSQLEGVRRILCWKQYLWKAGRWGALGWRTFVSFTPEIHDDTSWNLHLLEVRKSPFTYWCL